jgi:hypothetical protein
MPFNPEEVQSKAEDLLHNKADKGDKNGLSEELNNMTMADQIAVAQKMQEIRQNEKATNSKLPDVEITTTTDTGGRKHLEDIKMVDKGWIWDSKTDVYDPPRNSGGMFGQTQDIFRDRNKQLAEAMGEK